MAVEEEPEAGIPEWVVTFGDMMSLLLTFFIMLVSMSEIKQEELYQAMVESMRRRFGHDASTVSMVPGHLRPRNSAMKELATMGRSARANMMQGGDKVQAPVGENPRVQMIRPGKHAAVGGVIYFAEDSAELSEENKRQLQIAAKAIAGKPQKIEIRGHTSRLPTAEDAPYRDNWDLAYARCRATMKFLVGLGIDRRRIRLGVASDNEPAHSGIDPIERRKNARVEVFMWDERVQDLDATHKDDDKSPGGAKEKSEQ
jgi:chemotaxis protein MotB